MCEMQINLPSCEGIEQSLLANCILFGNETIFKIINILTPLAEKVDPKIKQILLAKLQSAKQNRINPEPPQPESDLEKNYNKPTNKINPIYS